MAGSIFQALAEPVQPEVQKKSRSGFEYHDGRAEERRPYRRPQLDVDPTNLTVEELRERVIVLEERIERLEYLITNPKRGN